MAVQVGSGDLRIRVVASVERGVPMGRVAEVFGVSASTIKGLAVRRRADPHRAHLLAELVQHAGNVLPYR
jgi:transposase